MSYEVFVAYYMSNSEMICTCVCLHMYMWVGCMKLCYAQGDQKKRCKVKCTRV